MDSATVCIGLILVSFALMAWAAARALLAPPPLLLLPPSILGRYLYDKLTADERAVIRGTAQPSINEAFTLRAMGLFDPCGDLTPLGRMAREELQYGVPLDER